MDLIIWTWTGVEWKRINDWNACIHGGDRPARRSVVGGGQLVVRALSDEDDVIDERCDGRAYEGAEPVHPVVLPDAGDDGWAEGQCAAGEDVGADCEEPSKLSRLNRVIVH